MAGSEVGPLLEMRVPVPGWSISASLKIILGFLNRNQGSLASKRPYGVFYFKPFMPCCGDVLNNQRYFRINLHEFVCFFGKHLKIVANRQ